MKPRFVYNNGKMWSPPVSPDRKVELIFREHGMKTHNLGMLADHFIWKHKGMASDIIAYRVITKEKQ